MSRQSICYSSHFHCSPMRIIWGVPISVYVRGSSFMLYQCSSSWSDTILLWNLGSATWDSAKKYPTLIHLFYFTVQPRVCMDIQHWRVYDLQIIWERNSHDIFTGHTQPQDHAYGESKGVTVSSQVSEKVREPCSAFRNGMSKESIERV